VVAFLTGHRADDRQLFCDFGEMGPMLGDANARRGRVDGLGWPLRFRARLGIERLKLARAAGHPKQDAPPALFPQLVGVEAHATEPVQSRECGRTDADSAEETTAADRTVRAYPHIHARLVFVRHDNLFPFSGRPRAGASPRGRPLNYFLMRNSVEFTRL